MSNLKRRISVSDDLRNQLEGHLDDLVSSGDVKIPSGKRIRLNRAGIPKLVEASTPTMSKQRIFQVYLRTVELTFARSAEWGPLQVELDKLINDEGPRANITHVDLLRRIEAVQNLVVDDFETLVGLDQKLKDSPDHIKNAKFGIELPRIIGRILNKLPPRRALKQTKDEVMDMWTKLKKYSYGVYLLVDRIRQCHRDARANPNHQRHFGEVAAQCLTTLVTAMAPWDPRNDMDHEVFRSLKERVDGTEDGTEDGAED